VQRAHGGFWKRGRPSNIIDLSISLNPMGVPDFILELIEEGLKEGVMKKYPPVFPEEGLIEGVREIIEDYEREIVFCAGATNCIWLISSILNGVDVVCPEFSEITISLNSLNKDFHVHNLVENEGKFEVSVCRKPFISNPHNPTGQWFDIREGIVDCSFSFFLDTKLCSEYEIGIYSMSKLTSLPGLKMGFIAGGKETVSRIMKVRHSWPLDSLTYYVYYRVFNERMKELRHFISQTRVKVGELRDNFKALLSPKFKVFDSKVNYLMIKGNVIKLKEELLGKKIYIKTLDYDCLQSNSYARIALPDLVNYDKVMRVLKEVVSDRI